MTDEQYFKLQSLISIAETEDQIHHVGMVIKELPESLDKEDLVRALIQKLNQL